MPLEVTAETCFLCYMDTYEWRFCKFFFLQVFLRNPTVDSTTFRYNNS